MEKWVGKKSLTLTIIASNKHAWCFYKQMSHAFNDQGISASLCKGTNFFSCPCMIMLRKFVILAMNFYELDSYRKHCRQEVLLASIAMWLTKAGDNDKKYDEEKVSRLIFALKTGEGTCLWNVISAQFIFFLLPQKLRNIFFVYGEILPCSNKITCLFLLKNFCWARKTFLTARKTSEENDMFETHYTLQLTIV